MKPASFSPPKRLLSLRYWAVLVWLILGISGCASPTGGGGKNLRSEHVQTWVGEVSCPGCSERWLALTLFPDGLFRLRESYVAGKGGAGGTGIPARVDQAASPPPAVAPFEGPPFGTAPAVAPR